MLSPAGQQQLAGQQQFVPIYYHIQIRWYTNMEAKKNHRGDTKNTTHIITQNIFITQKNTLVYNYDRKSSRRYKTPNPKP
jgi:hypothetical protein